MKIDYRRPAPETEQGAHLGCLLRHLKARVEEFHCITVQKADETTGELALYLEGFSSKQVQEALEQTIGVVAEVEDDCLVFYLREHHRNETNDSIWGGLYRYICIDSEKKET